MTGKFIALIARRLVSCGLALNVSGHAVATNGKLGK